MGTALWNVNDSLSTHELVARIKASARQRQGLVSDSVAGTSSISATEPNEGEAVAVAQAEVNQLLLQSLDLVIHDLEYLQTQVGLVEAWVREETERSAQLQQGVNQQLSQILHLVAGLSARVSVLEDRAAVRNATRRLSWPRLAGLVRPPRQP